MNKEATRTLIEDLELEQDRAIPNHPLFGDNKDQASFTDCLDAIDRVRSIIALYDFLELDDSRGGLSSEAAFGYYWVSVTTKKTLSYVSNRLMVLNRQNKKRYAHESAYLSALFNSLHTLGRDNRERFLNNTASQMNTTRSAVDKFARKKTKR